MEPEDLEPGKNDEEFDITEHEPNKGGRPKKEFKDLGSRMKRKRIQSLVDDIEEKAEECGMNFYETVGRAAEMKANQDCDRPKAKIFKAIANNEDPYAHTKMPVEDAIALKVQHSVEIARFYYHSDFT